MTEDAMMEMKEAANEAFGKAGESMMTVDKKAMEISAWIIDGITKQNPYAWTSLPVRTHDEKIAMMKHLGSKENGIDELIKQGSFPVQDVIITPASFVDADGKPVIAPRCTLISPDGKSLSIMAKVWVTEFVSSWALLGLPPWGKPISVGATQEKGHGTNRYYSFKVT